MDLKRLACSFCRLQYYDVPFTSRALFPFQLNPYLMALSGGTGESVEVRTNVVGVIVKMLDKSHGLLQVRAEEETCLTGEASSAYFLKAVCYFNNGSVIEKDRFHSSTCVIWSSTFSHILNQN